jgi:predicted nucleic acid-binding protein
LKTVCHGRNGNSTLIFSGFGWRLYSQISKGTVRGDRQFLALKVPEDTVIEMIALLRKQEITIHPATVPQIVIRDLDDLPVLAAAIESKADYLVSGDKDIISLFPLKEIKIATPREFWTVISKIYPI